MSISYDDNHYTTGTSNLFIAVHDFPMCTLASLSADEILLPRYVNLFTKFCVVSLKVETKVYETLVEELDEGKLFPEILSFLAI